MKRRRPQRTGTAQVRVESAPGRVELHMDLPEPTQHAEMTLNQTSMGEFVGGLLRAGVEAGFSQEAMMDAIKVGAGRAG